MYEYNFSVVKIIDGDTVDVDLDLGFSYPLAGGEFQGGASDILSENPGALLGYSYKKGDPESAYKALYKRGVLKGFLETEIKHSGR